MRQHAAAIGAALVLFMVAAVPIAVAATPTLGARLTPIPVVVEVQPWVEVTNLSTVPVIVELEFIDGNLDGWQLAEESFPLAVDELRRVAVTAGPETVTIRATLTPQDAPQGTESSVLVLETAARHESLLEAHGDTIGVGLLIAAFLFIVGLAAVLRWQDRRT